MPVVSFEEFLKQAGGKPLDVKVVQPTETVEPIKKSLGEKIITPAKESVASLLELYGGGERGIATKLKEDIKAGAEDIEQGKVLKGIAKTGFRTAGDVAGTIYAPIGALLGTTGLNKVFEKVGEVSQMGGRFNPINLITDIPEVQQFVENHPNLEEDFGRMANLIMAGMDKGKIEPSTVIPRTIEQAKIAGETIIKPIIKPVKMMGDFVSEIKQKAQEKVMSNLSKNVDELLTQTRGIQGKVKLAEQKNTQIGEVLKDPNVYRGLKVENNKIIPDEAISVIDNRIERLLNAKKEIISEIDDFVPKTSQKIVRQKAINEINADTKITPADKRSVVEAINKQLDFLPDEMSVKELDQFRATFRQSARDAKGLLKRSSEYATLEKAFRDTEFMVTDNLQSLGIDKAGQFKSLNNYVKDMINTKEFLDKTLRGQTVKGGRAGIIAGRVVGAIAGSQGGILTAILGSEAGGFVAKILTNNQLGSSVKLRLIKSMTDNPQILKQVEEFLTQTKDYTPPMLPPAEKGGFRTTTYGTRPIKLPSKPESIRSAEEQARIQAQLKNQREKPNISRQNTAKTTINIKKSISQDSMTQLAQEAKKAEAPSADVLDPRKFDSAEEFADSIVIGKRDPIVNGKVMGKDFGELKPLVSYRKTSDFLGLGEYKFNEGVLKGKIGAGQELIQGKVNHWKERISKGERPIVIIEDKPYVSKITDNLQGGRQYDAILEARVRQGHSRLEAYKQLGIKEVPVVSKSQLISKWKEANKKAIPKKAPSADVLDPRKFDSAEGFVKAQPTFFHGTSEEVANALLRGEKPKLAKPIGGEELFGGKLKVFSLTPDKSEAVGFAQQVEGLGIKRQGKVVELFIDPNANIRPLREAIGVEDIQKFIKENKVDAFREGTEISVVNPNILKTKSQLTDFWKEANKKGFFKGGIKGNIDQSKTYVITDIKNKFVGHYIGDKNSVDNFVKKLGTGFQYKKMNE